MKNILIEAQAIPQEERINFIFKTFDALENGESITIRNNHDPERLIGKFNDFRPAQFVSEYLVSGPTEWEVKLTKKTIEGCCGCC